MSSIFGQQQTDPNDPYGFVSALRAKQMQVPPVQAQPTPAPQPPTPQDPYAYASPAKAALQSGGGAGGPVAGVQGRDPNNDQNDGRYRVNIPPPDYEDVPALNRAAIMRNSGSHGGLMSIIGSAGSNEAEVAAANARNDMKERRYKDQLDSARIEATANQFSHLYGSSGGFANRPVPVTMSDGTQVYVQKNPRTGQYDQLPGNAVLPGVEAAAERNKGTIGAAQVRGDTSRDAARTRAAVAAARAGRAPSDFESYSASMKSEGKIPSWSDYIKSKSQLASSGKSEGAPPKESAASALIRELGRPTFGNPPPAQGAPAQRTPINKKVQLPGGQVGYTDGNGNPLQAGGAPAQAAPAQAFKSPDDVKAAYRSGKLSKVDATKLLQSQFGMQ